MWPVSHLNTVFLPRFSLNLKEKKTLIFMLEKPQKFSFSKTKAEIHWSILLSTVIDYTISIYNFNNNYDIRTVCCFLCFQSWMRCCQAETGKRPKLKLSTETQKFIYVKMQKWIKVIYSCYQTSETLKGLVSKIKTWRLKFKKKALNSVFISVVKSSRVSFWLTS